MTQTLTYALSKLSSLDWMVVFTGLGLVAALEVSKVQPEPLSRGDQAFLDWGRDASGHGAFARGNNGSFGWVSGRGSAQAAREDAFAYCDASGSGCRVIATHDSTVFNAYMDKQITPRASKHFDVYLQNPWPRAFAISEDGSVGYASDAGSVEEATQAALKTCRYYQTQKDRPDFLTDRPCVVVHQNP